MLGPRDSIPRQLQKHRYILHPYSAVRLGVWEWMNGHSLADCTQPMKYKRNILTFEWSLLDPSKTPTREFDVYGKDASY